MTYRCGLCGHEEEHSRYEAKEAAERMREHRRQAHPEIPVKKDQGKRKVKKGTGLGRWRRKDEDRWELAD